MQISGYFTPGTFQQYTLAPASYVTPVPAGLDPAAAAPLMCAGLTVYSALKKAGIRRDADGKGNGDWIAITGAGGGLGHLGIQYAKAMGARVVAVDSGDKKAFCEGLGADVFVNFADAKFSRKEGENGGLEGEVKSVSGGGVRAVIACAANMRSYAQGLGMLGYRGKLVCVGVPDGVERPIDGSTISKFIGLEISIIGMFHSILCYLNSAG
jgi:propanol-preferring alcohol dehydrogenase